MKIIDFKGADIIISDTRDGNMVGNHQPDQNSVQNQIELLKKAREAGIKISNNNLMGFGIKFSNLVYQLTEDDIKQNPVLWDFDIPKIAPYYDEKKDYSTTDAVITDVEGVYLGTGFADCTGGIIYDPNKNAIALMHLGRDNVQANLELATIAQMKQSYGSNVKDLCVYLGPTIDGKYFLHDRVDRLTNPKWNGYIKQTPNGYTVDILNPIYNTFRRAGVPISNIEINGSDTYTDDLYFSHKKGTEEQEEYKTAGESKISKKLGRFRVIAGTKK